MSYQERRPGGGHSQSASRGPVTERVDIDSVRKIIIKDEPQLLVLTAQAIGKQMAEQKVTTSQVRNIFGPVRVLQLRWRVKDSQEADDVFRQIMLLRPKIAYQAKRTANLAMLRDVLDAAIEEIGKAETREERFIRFRRFVELFEAILAYHTAEGGKTS